MKKTRSFFAAVLCVLVCFSMLACGENERTEEKYDASLAVSFSVNADAEYVNPFVYGQFIEHIEDCIYDGIWAEIVLDRKFYYEIGKSGLSPWKTSDSGKTSSITDTVLSNGYAAKISEDGDIFQEKLSVEKKEYSGYFWCKAETGCKVKITLSSKSGENSVTVDVPPNDAFTKYDYSVQCDFSVLAQAAYTLEVTEGEGIFDSLSMMPADNWNGMRKDTLEELKSLNSPMYRWPGGNFLSGYEWTDGVGEIDKRPSRRNLHYMGLESGFDSPAAMEASDMVKLNQLGFYGGIEPNDYGLDEFMLMCEYLDAEPLMMVNDGLGSVESAAAQVEYCNGAAGTEYGALRAANGHSEPYGIKYWGVGNEMFGSWQLGNVPIAEYTVRHNLFTDAMKAVDEDIYIVAVGDNANPAWDNAMFSDCADKMDFIAQHMYARRDEYDVFEHLKNMKSNISGRIQNHRDLLKKYHGAADVKIAFTEYAYSEVTSPSRLKDGMGIGVFLNAVLSNADVFELCCYSSTVNATQGCITTEADGAVMQGAGYVLKLYRDYMQRYALKSAVKYDAQYQLDISVTVSEDRKTAALAVVNPSEYAVNLTNKSISEAKSITRHSLIGDFYDSYNSTKRDELHTQSVTGLKNAVAPAMSVSVFIVSL